MMPRMMYQCTQQDAWSWLASGVPLSPISVSRGSASGVSLSPTYEAVAGCVTYSTSIESGFAPGGAVIVMANGTVPVSGFTKPALRARPDLVTVDGGFVLDFVAAAPPRDKPQNQVETRLSATFRIEGAAAAGVRVVQVRAALGSRAVQVPK